MSYDDHRYSDADRAAVYRAILRLGPVEEFYPASMLELEGWAQGRPLEDMVFSDSWGNSV